MALGKFKKGATSISDIASNAKYLDSLTGIARQSDEFIENSAELARQTTTLKRIASSSPGVLADEAVDLGGDQLKSLKNILGDDDWAKLVEAKPDLANKLNSTLAAGDDVIEAGSDAAKKADDLDLDNIDDLNRLDSLPRSQRKIVIDRLGDKYYGMSTDALKLEGDKFFEAGDDGIRAFKKLPTRIQADIAAANPRLRWKAGQTPAGFEWVKGACRDYPKMCAIGAAGGIVGAGFAAKEVYDKVEEVFDDKEEEKRACIATCLPDDFYESEVSGYGTKEYKDLNFRTVEDVIESSGDNNITAQNTPLCTASMDPPEKCQQMCVERCDEIHQTFLQSLVRGAGELVGGAAGAAAGAAGEGLRGFLDGLFGEGMGIPVAIGIFIVFIAIIILSTMM